MISETLSNWSSNAIFFINKTVDSTLGQQKVTRLIVSIIKLSQEIFPSYKELLNPVSEALYGYKSLCYATMIFSRMEKVTKEKSFVQLYGFITSIFLTLKYLQDVKIIPFSKDTIVPTKIGEKGSESLIKGIGNFVGRNFKYLCIGGEAVATIGVVVYAHFKNQKTKSKSFGKERWLLVGNRIGKFTLACMSVAGWKGSLINAGIDLGTSLLGYSKFLVTDKSS